MHYNYVIDAGPDDAFLNGFAIFIIILCIIIVAISIISLILTTIGKWKVLEKAGKPGWPALIPYYNTFQLCEITGIRPIWIIANLLFTAGGSIITGILSAIPFLWLIATVVSTASFAISVYFAIILNISLAKSFDKEDTFAIGLILLPPVFYMILGLDSSKYKGTSPMKDTVYDFVNSKIDLSCFGSLTKSSAESKEAKGEFIKKCTLCGNKNLEKSKFCSVCGNKL